MTMMNEIYMLYIDILQKFNDMECSRTFGNPDQITSEG